MERLYVCVGEYMPEMTPGRRYNSPSLPVIGGTHVYKIRDIFDDLSLRDDSYIELSVLPDTKIEFRPDGICIDSYTFISRTELTQHSILQALYRGARPTKELIDWCISYNLTSEVFTYIIEEYGVCPIVDYIFSLYMKLIAFEHNNTVIEKLIEAGYDIHVGEDSLFLFAACTKNINLCRFLLKHDANIPKQAFNIFLANKELYPSMYVLLRDHKDKIR